MTAINFLQIVEQTHEQKVEMYSKCEKSELIEMLIQCNTIIASMPPRVLVWDGEEYKEISK